MRIISGTHKGTVIRPPAGLPVRPTTDTAKEGLFNILGNRYDLSSCRVLDLFAGTGHISYEFCSRGAAAVECVDRDHGCIRFIHEMKRKLGLEQLVIHKAVVSAFLRNTGQSFDIIFADPPYDMPDIPGIARLVFDRKLLKPGGTLVIEHARQLNLKSFPNFVSERHYGQSVFSFFNPATE